MAQGEKSLNALDGPCRLAEDGNAPPDAQARSLLGARDVEIMRGLTEIFREVFDDETLTITPSTSTENVALWDSLHHINLIMTVRVHFGIRFKKTEVEKLTDVRSLVAAIRGRLG